MLRLRKPRRTPTHERDRRWREDDLEVHVDVALPGDVVAAIAADADTAPPHPIVALDHLLLRRMCGVKTENGRRHILPPPLPVHEPLHVAPAKRVRTIAGRRLHFVEAEMVLRPAAREEPFERCSADRERVDHANDLSIVAVEDELARRLPAVPQVVRAPHEHDRRAVPRERSRPIIGEPPTVLPLSSLRPNAPDRAYSTHWLSSLLPFLLRVVKRTCVLGWLPSSSASCPWVQLGQCMEYSFLPWLAQWCIRKTHGGGSMEPGWAGRGCGSMVRWSSDRQAYLVLLESRSGVDHTPSGVPPPFAPEVGVLFSARSEHLPRTSNVTDTGEQSSSGLDPRPTIPPGGPLCGPAIG